MGKHSIYDKTAKASKTTKYNVFIVSILCVAIFFFISAFMNNQTEKTIEEVSSIYMEGLNDRISMHFSTMINYCLAKIETITAEVPTGALPPHQEWDQLAEVAKSNGFTYLALYSSENGGEFQIIYGEPIEIVTIYDPFREALDKNEKRVIVGRNESGDKSMILGIAAAYAMESGKTSTAILGGLPHSYIGDILNLEDENPICQSYIIRRNGSFVIQNEQGYDNYFELVEANPDEYFGTHEIEYAEKLEAAIQNNDKYGEVISIGDNRLQIYCTRLPHSDWFLITEMPTGAIYSAVNNLGTNWNILSIVSCATILILFYLVLRNYVSEHKKATEKALRAEEEALEAKEEALSANKAKSEFLSNMSHDIRTPLNAIVGMNAIALNHLDNPQQVEHCLKKISTSSRLLLGLINNVLDMSKIETGHLTLNIEQFSLRELMNDIINSILPQVNAKEQSFDIFTENITAENICCDRVRLNQIILNLLTNAVKFTPAGGAIYMYLEEEPSPKGEDYVRLNINVKDTGIGMSKEFIKSIFDSFARENNKNVRRIEGSGLGMAITKYIVDKMGGTIEVKSIKGKGSSFYVALDLKTAQIGEENMTLPPWKMLIVDDDKPLCVTAAESLKEIGVEAEWTLSGEDAIEMVKKRYEQNDPYKVILMDWKLPGKDGIETARHIRKHTEDDVPILLISAYEWGEIEENAKEAGINGFISKPLFKSTLYYGLKPHIDREIENNPASANKKKYNFNGKRILVAEDIDLNWEIVDALLSEQGLILERAQNGSECVEMFENSKPGYYDMILMDVQMPVKSGIDAAREIRATERSDNNLPIIAMTANAFSDDIVACIEIGMNAHIAKPIDIAEVLKTINKYLN